MLGLFYCFYYDFTLRDSVDITTLSLKQTQLLDITIFQIYLQVKMWYFTF